MDEEIDEWFKLEQQKLEDKFKATVIERIQSGESTEEDRREFNKKMDVLIAKYQNKFFTKWGWQKRKTILMKPVKLINKGMHEFVVAFRE